MVPHAKLLILRGVAQPGRAPGSGPGGPEFESPRPDQIPSIVYRRRAQKQPTHLPTHIALPDESKVRILRSWQRALTSLSVPANPFSSARTLLGNLSISMSEVSGAACRERMRRRDGQKDRTPRRQSMVGFFHLWATDANSRCLRTQEGKDARTGFDSDAGFSIELESVRLRQEKPVRSAAEEERRQRRKGEREKERPLFVPASTLKRPERAAL